MKLQVKVSSASNAGSDYCIVNQELNLFVVCDGVGSNESAKLAAKIAGDAFHESIKKNIKETSTPAGIQEQLGVACSVASKSVYDYGKNNPKFKGLACSMDAAIVHDGRIYILHVGDGSIYQNFEKKLNRLTVFHTFGNHLIEQEGYSPEKAQKSPYFRTVEKAIGLHPYVVPDLTNIELERGDHFILCSGGLVRAIDQTALQSSVNSNTPEELAKKILSNQKQSSENISVISIYIASQTTEVPKSKPLTREEKITRLKQVEFFKLLSRNDINRLLSIAKIEVFRPETVITQGGSAPDKFWVLVSGKVGFYKDGQDSPFNETGPGVCLGESAIFSSEKRLNSMKTLSQSTVLTFDGNEFTSLIKKDTNFATRVYESIGTSLFRRLGQLVNKI